MNIHANGTTSFSTTAGGATLAISDMAELEGVSLNSLQAANINFLSNDEIANSSYLDFTGYRITDATTVVEAYGLDGGQRGGRDHGRHQRRHHPRSRAGPDALLSQNWGTRQQTLAQLEDEGTLWSTYGADQAQYDAVVAELTGTYGLTVLDGNTANGNYVSSAESRTIWVAIDTPAQFLDLFGKTLYNNNDGDNSFLFWNGNLSLPSEWNVQGLWFDTDNAPPPSNMTPGVSATLPQGPQSIGNTTASVPNMAPQDIAALYNFPLVGQSVCDGHDRPDRAGHRRCRARHRNRRHVRAAAGELPAVDPPDGNRLGLCPGPDGQDYAFERCRRALARRRRRRRRQSQQQHRPLQRLGLPRQRRRLGLHGPAECHLGHHEQPGRHLQFVRRLPEHVAGLAFYQAYWQLYVDAALRNQTVFAALGDGGSGNETGNGLTNVEINLTSPYSVLVGGTSLSTLATAQADPTLTSSVVTPALAGDRATIWQLVAGGLTSLPSDASALQSFVETVWNTYQVNGSTIGTSDDFDGGYLQNTTTSGGVDPTQPAPWYQTAYGLNPVTSTRWRSRAAACRTSPPMPAATCNTWCPMAT